MTQSVNLGANGLFTDPGPFTAAPEGGMVEAQNVVVLRPGVIEPRPGSKWYVDAYLKNGGIDDTSAYAYAIYCDPDDDKWVWAWNLDFSTWHIRKNATDSITGPTFFLPGKIRVCPTGGRALFTSENGVCTLPSQQASPLSGDPLVAYRAGMPQPFTPTYNLTSVGATWLQTNYAVAYRFTLRRRLADGTIVESAPSNRVVVRNDSGGTRSPFFGTPLAWSTPDAATNDYGDLIAGDELCVYRSPSVTPSTSEPSDEMMLRAVLPFNTTYRRFVDPYDPSAVSTWKDRAADGTWSGPALYTNATQEGAALANYRPEYARDIALYKGMTFYAGAKTAPRVDLRLSSCGDTSSPSTSLLHHVFGSTVSINAGSPVISGISATDMAFLAVGQVVTSAGVDPGLPGGFPANAQIQSIDVGAGTATMSANALVTSAAITLECWDWVEVFDFGTGDTLRCYTTTGVGIISSSNIISFDSDVGAQDAEYQWNDKFLNPDPWQRIQLRVSSGSSQTRDMVWSFFRADVSDEGFSVRSTKPAAWDPPVGPDSDTQILSLQQGGVAVLRWSKVNEPEHCPLPYATTIGDASSPIRRIVAARQSLLIFKDDGLYQWYGDTPTDYRIELVDRTIELPPATSLEEDEACKWVGRFDDRVYAMTTRGPMAITDSGGQPVGAPILESLRRRFATSYGAGDTTMRALMVDTQSRRVGFFYHDDDAARGYVLDVDTGTWTFWSWPRRIADFSVLQSTGAPYFAGGYSQGYLVDDRTMLDDASVTVDTLPTTCEQWPGEACTISSVTGSGPYTVTIDADSEWTPAVGDLLVRDGVAHVVTDVTSATVFETATQPTTGLATWREGFECRCVWTARSEGNVGAEKGWISVAFPFELTTLFSRYVDARTSTGLLKGYFKGYRNPSSDEQYVDETQSIGAEPYPIEPAFKRVSVPRELAHDWALRVGFTIRQACAWFATAGISVLFEQSAPDKVTR